MSAEIMLIGLNHSTAPVEIREKITFPGDQEGQVTRKFLEAHGVTEAMIISTCNRSEVVFTAETTEPSAESVIDTIGRIHSLDPGPFREYLYLKQGSDAVRHLFRVSASLDSMVLGEPQILGQVKESYRRAAKAKATGPVMNRMLHRAFFTAKRVRSETGIGIAAVSVAYVAVELADKILGELHDKSVLLVGAGEMAELAARHLRAHAGRPVTVVNRTYENACTLARRLDGSAEPMDRLVDALAMADVVITSTGSCDPIICTGDMKTVMKKRRHRPIFIIDIAIPRDVDPRVNTLDGVYLYNIDDLQAVVHDNLEERRQEAVKAELIVEEEVEKFLQWTRSLDATPTIVALVERLEEIRQGELARLNGKLSSLEPGQRETVDMITKSIINKIAHEPISFLKRAGSTPRGSEQVYAVQRIFKLGGATEDHHVGEESEE